MNAQDIENWAQVQIDRINAEKKKHLEAIEKPNPNSSDGNKKEYSVEDEYPVQEGKSQ